MVKAFKIKRQKSGESIYRILTLTLEHVLKLLSFNLMNLEEKK